MFRNKGLLVLFKLALLGGFFMFSLLFYAPLLFQGGFGMSPKDAGVVITPLVAFITIGSIVNGRIVPRVRNPNLMIHAGFTCMVVASLGLIVATHTTSHLLLMTTMTFAGLGFGFVMANLTIFVQQTAGREHLGIATALLQSVRMIGGMIGTALTGAIVGHMYASGVRNTLATNHATQWFAELGDPQILIDHPAQATLLAQLSNAGHDGAKLLEAARDGLVFAIHMGFAMAALIALVALWYSRRVPPIKFGRQAEPPPFAD
jgi:MFS family permease